MNIHPQAVVMLKHIPEIVMSFLALMIVGCNDEVLPSRGRASVTNNFTEQVQQKILRLMEQIDSDEGRVSKSAHGLYVEITSVELAECYDDLARIYLHKIKDLHFDVMKDAMGDEKENNRLDSRLRNLWSISESAAATVLHRHPASLEGWDLLINVILKYREAAVAAGRAMERLDVKNPIQCRKHRRYSLFKREMMSMSEAYTCTIGWMYEACRHRLTPQQRKSVCHKVRTALGELPSEMAKDDAETLTKDTQGK